MTRRDLLGLALLPHVRAQQPEPHTYYGQLTNKLFFLDAFYLERVAGAEFRMHQPVKEPGNPILRPEHVWEGWRTFPYGRSVFRDPGDGLYKMWYETMHDGLTTGKWEQTSRKRTAYAVSKDGLEWTRPDLGQVERGGNTHNSILGMGPFGVHFANVLRDAHEEDPRRRYKMMFYGMPLEGPRSGLPQCLNVAASPDGTRWSLLRAPEDAPFGYHPQKYPKKPGAGDAVSLVGWVERRGRYVALVKHGGGPAGSKVLPHGYRTVCLTESEDFLEWSRPVSVLAPDEHDAPGTEFYYMHVFPYADLYVGLLCVYHNYTRRHYAWAEPTQECPPELRPLLDRLDVRLAWSRDLEVWRQAGGRKAFLPNTDDAWDSGMIFPSSLVDVGKETWLYYGASPMRHVQDELRHAGETIRGQVQGIFGGLARLRRDGFVSLSAGAAGGECVTRALAMSGEDFVLNARTEPEGEVVIRLPGSDLPPLRFQGDATEQRLALPPEWKTKVAAVRTKLHIALRRADLFTLSI